MNAAVVTVLGSVVVAAIAAGGVSLGHVYKRLGDVESELRGVKSHNRKLWAWARKTLDLYYRHRKDGSPEPDPLPEEEW